MGMSKVGDKCYSSVELEEHYVSVSEEGKFYLFHVTSEGGSSRGIAKCTYNEIERTIFENSLCILVLMGQQQ